MPCPDNHPDDKYGKENCRAWCPKNKFIWATWHYTIFNTEERCMCAEDPPMAILVWKPSYFRTLALFTRLKFRRLGMRLRILRMMYVATVKHVIEASIYQYLIDKLSERHDD